ncbi:MAG: flavodoxin-dependent (E)-4-hydroxy-3-methylbut-2-enyl-diphosphate synthase [Lentisphaeraceae bacterium]|nr:flavodoxin-dependent (E)-4-hydroxy-3-methylbut-2-enyl-diphosphate synthase [Lentisphaeraceae bacterium]
MSGINEVRIGDVKIGGDNPIMVQSMAATRTQDTEATLRQVESIRSAGAGLVRVAIDSNDDVKALQWIRERTEANLVVDLQENYLLAEKVAPFVQKFRYNPGHLHHLQKKKSIEDKAFWLAEIAQKNDCAMRIGVNCGSVAPAFLEKYPDKDEAIIQSAIYHVELMDKAGFKNYCVSIKDSDPETVIRLNERFFELRPDVPLHLGVTEAGMPPAGVVKTRQAFEALIPKGIGSTVRVSLTLPFDKKSDEIRVGKSILEDIKAGKFWNQKFHTDGYNIISCPSCSRVENEKFIELAEKVRQITEELGEKKMTIAVMGCRVNGPGETDDADLGLWCGPRTVNLKKGEESIGAYSYEEILPRLEEEIKNFD